MYPYNYQQNRYQYQPPQDIQFVNGKASAESFMLPPNSRVILMDSTQARFYLKEVDAAGMYKVKTYEFSEVIEKEPSNDYITREEFEQWKAMLNESNSSKQQPVKTVSPVEF